MRVLVFALAVFVASVNASIMTVDLGSEFLKLAVLKRGKPIQIVENIAAQRKSESVVAFDKKNIRHFSNGALKLSTRFPSSTFRFLLTLAGQEYDSPATHIYHERFPVHNLSADARGMIQITDDDGEVHAVEEYLAMMLQFCVDITTKFGGEPVKSAIIAVPPFFTQAERNAVLASAQLIDLRISQLINADLAAAINYGSFRADTFKKKAEKVMIVDIGSTSTTATLFNYRWTKNKEIGRQQPIVDVVASGYDRNLGGLDFDFVIRDILVERFHEMKGVKEDVTKNERAMARLLIEAEKVKKVLSANRKTSCYIENLAEDKDFKTVLTRDEFEERAAATLAKVSGPINQLLREVAAFETPLDMSDISSVILIGGGSRIPIVRSLLMDAIGGRELDFNLNGDEAIALGAAYRAADVSPSYRVPQKWTVKSGVMYPVLVSFTRPARTTPDGEEEPAKEVTKVLFDRMNGLPQKKTMTFTKHKSDFDLHVYYDNLDLHGDQAKFIGSHNLSTVKVHLSEALKDGNPEHFEAVKVQFSMDASGLFLVDGIEAVFNETKVATKDAGVVGGIFSNLWGSETDNNVQEDEAAASAEDQAKDTEPAAEERESNDSSGDTEDLTKDADTDAEGANTTDGGKTESDAEPGAEAQEEVGGDNAKEDTIKSEPTSKSNKKNKRKIGSKKGDGIVINVVSFHEETQAGLEEAQFKKTQANLVQMATEERERLERADANSQLEAYALECRMRLIEDEWELVTTEEERDIMKARSNEISDWLYEDGMDATTADYKEKLRELEMLMAPMLHRKTERELLPEVAAQMTDILNTTLHFINTTRNETWRVRADVDRIEKLMNETAEWFDDKQRVQAEMAPHVDPVLTTDMILGKIQRLSQETFKEMTRRPPPPPKKEKNKSEKQNGTQAENVTQDDGIESEAGSEDGTEGTGTENEGGDAETEAHTSTSDESATDEEPERRAEAGGDAAFDNSPVGESESEEADGTENVEHVEL